MLGTLLIKRKKKQTNKNAQAKGGIAERQVLDSNIFPTKLRRSRMH